MATLKASSSTSASRSDPKRKRAASPSAGSSSAPTPSSTYFYEDGNVQLHVGKTLYKVHRSILSQAEVFRDTLLVGGAAGKSALVDGGRGEDRELATIRLDDNQHDFDVFVRAMYNSCEIRSLLRLADKYNHPFLLSAAQHSFVKRVESERSAWVAVDVHPTFLAKFDPKLDPKDFQIYIGLLSVSEEFSVSKDACVWLHEALACLPLSVRQKTLFAECEVEGMTVSLSRDALGEVIARIDNDLERVRMLARGLLLHVRHCSDCDPQTDEEDNELNEAQNLCAHGQRSICRDLIRKMHAAEGSRIDIIVDALLKQSDRKGPYFDVEGKFDDVDADCLDVGVRTYLKRVRKLYVDSIDLMVTKKA